MSLPTESAKEYLLKKYLYGYKKHFDISHEDARSNTQGDKAKGLQMKRKYEKSEESSWTVGNTEASDKTATQSLQNHWEQGERVKVLKLQGD